MASVANRLPVKPVLSTSAAEARRRVLNLYRAWYREVSYRRGPTRLHLISISLLKIPRTVSVFALDVSIKQARQKLREEFLKNKDVKDPRAIDLLVVKVCVSSGDLCWI